MLGFDLAKQRDPLERSILKGESLYDFLDRCGRPEAEAARHLWNELVQLIPAKQIPEFSGRLRSREDHNVISAYFELRLLWEFNSRSIAASLIDPRSPNANGDIAITIGENCETLECTVHLPDAAKQRRDMQLHHLFTDIGNLVENKRLRVSIIDVCASGTQASAKRVASWLDGLRQLPATDLRFEDPRSDWWIELDVIEIEHDLPQNHSLIAVGITEVYLDESPSILLEEIKNKRHQHGRTAIPALAWNDFAQEPSMDQVKRVVASYAATTQSPVSLIYCGHCYPWTTGQLRPTLLWTGEPPPLLSSNWPWESVWLDTDIPE